MYDSYPDCAHKRGYPSEQEAREMASYRMSVDRRLELRVYYCSTCGRWHLTSKPAWT